MGDRARRQKHRHQHQPDEAKMAERDDVAQGKESHQHPRAVERRDRDQVEERERAVHHHPGVAQECQRGEERAPRAAAGRSGRAGRSFTGHGDDPHQQRERQRQEQVGGRARERHLDRIVAGMAQVRPRDRHRLGPAQDHGRMEQQERDREQQRSHRIHVRQGIEREPPAIARRGVAVPQRHQSVGTLVHHDTQHECRKNHENRGVEAHRRPPPGWV